VYRTSTQEIEGFHSRHSFRRSSATLLVDAGADLFVLKKHGGWRSSTVAEDSIQNKIAISKQILSGVKEEETFEDESKPSTSTNKTNTEESMNFVTSDGLLRLSQVPVQFVGLKDCHFHFNCKYQ
jgi:hypothetical protein